MLNFFKSKEKLEINKEKIIREGWLSKESRYRKIWREYNY